MSDFESEMKLVFLEEATQLLEDAENSFLSLEQNPNDTKLLDKIFRLAHNLKGSANAVGFVDVGALTHDFESFLLLLKNGERSVSPREVTLLLKCNDRLTKMIQGLKADFAARFDCTDVIAEIKACMNDTPEAATDVPAASHGGFEDETPMSFAAASVVEPQSLHDAMLSSVTIPPDQLAKIMQATAGDVVFDDSAFETLQKQKLVMLPTPIPEQSVQSSAMVPQKETSVQTNKAPASDESIRVSSARLDRLLNYVGELVILQAVLAEQTVTNPSMVRKTSQQLGKVTKEVQEISMSLRMIPLKQTFQKLQRIVRDTSSTLNKKINFVIKGEETELDKTVLESLSDPLVHMVRNAVDHGVESNETRKLAGKPEVGTVRLEAMQRGDKLVIELEDDGGGLNPEKLLAKAIEKGIVKAGTKMSKKDCMHLIFAPGFSTKTEITDVSGRGVGMDVVKTNIEKLNGDVQIESEIGKGTRFTVTLPLSLAIVDAITIQSGPERYVVPLLSVHEGIKVDPTLIQFNSGIGESVVLRDENIRVFRLTKLLNKKTGSSSDGVGLIVRSTSQPFCLLIDEIIGQQQIVIKKLGGEVPHITGITGSAILGDGHPALILDLVELTASARESQAANRAVA